MERGSENVNEWVAIGEIAMLQVQRAKLVSDAQFNPDHIATCERLRLTPDGVYGFVKDSWILDKQPPPPPGFAALE